MLNSGSFRPVLHTRLRSRALPSMVRPVMRPADIQIIGSELAIKWEDGRESFVSLEILRRRCPCAGCRGEVDIMGNLYKNPEIPLSEASFRLVRMVPVGGYAVQFYWGDGHNSGLYAFDYLEKVAAATS